MYFAKSFDIVAYTFAADVYDVDCMKGIGLARISRDNPSRYVEYKDATTEEVLSVWAKELGIDPTDERSYDSGDFPKVVFRDQIEGEESCGACHQVIDE